MASRQKYSNNGTSTLLADFSIGETTCSVQAGHGARMASLIADEFFMFTLRDGAGNIEICKCTQRTGDTFNVVERAQEGTTERDWLAGDLVEIRITRDSLARFPQKDAKELVTAGWVFQGPANYVSAAGAGPAYTCTFDPALTTLTAGQEFNVKFASAVTSTTPTLNPNGLGAKSITRIDGVAITANDIPAGMIAKIHYDGAKFLLLNPATPGKFYAPDGIDRTFVNNLRITAAINGSNDIDIAVKGIDGNDPSASNPVRMAFRDATITNSASVLRTITAALSITPLSSSSLGFDANEQGYIYVYAYDDAGTVVLAVTKLALQDESTLSGNTTILGSSSDSAVTVYTTTALIGGTIYPVRLLARIKATRHATLDQWASVDEVTTLPEDSKGIGAYQNVTGSRAINTNYKNKTGRPILVKIHASGTTFGVYFLSFRVGLTASPTSEIDKNGGNVTAGNILNLGGIVPPGYWYRFHDTSGSTAAYTWHELTL